MNDPVFQNISPTEPPAPSKKASEAKKNASLLGLALGTFSLLPQLVALLLLLFVPLVFPAWVKSSWYVWAVQVFCLYIIGLSAFFLILGKKPLPPLPREGERFPRRWYFGFFCMMIFFGFAGSLISTVLTTVVSFLRGAPMENTTNTLIHSSPLIYVFLIVVVIGPIVEELVYRYAILRVLLPYGEKTAILVSGLIFGLIHENLFQLFYAGALGILFSYLYARTGKLRHTIAMHMLFNFFCSFLPVLILQFLPLDELMAGNPSFEVIFASILPILGLLLYELAYFGFAIAGLVIFIIRCRHARFYPAACPLDGHTRLRTYLLNPGMLFFFAVSLVLLILSVL